VIPMRLLAHLLNRFIRNGELRLIAADGSLHSFGGHGPGPTITVRLHDPRLHFKLFLNPELHAGEAHMNGTLTFEDYAVAERWARRPFGERPDPPRSGRSPRCSLNITSTSAAERSMAR
jgi:hypothetical protein